MSAISAQRVTPAVTPPPDLIVLTMTVDDARTLLTMLRHARFWPGVFATRRILDALESVDLTRKEDNP